MTSFDTGRRAEAVAVDFLQRKGCEIIAQNWRTRQCEIDIIALREDMIYFCEVKYRQTAAHGSGTEYVTPRKLRQMQFAAESWVHRFGWQKEYQLCVIEVSGLDFRITNVIKDVS